MDENPNYVDLRRVLSGAYDQSANGKGKERHANEKPFTQQPIMEIGRDCGPGFTVGQARKKLQEAMGMIHRGENEKAVHELRGVIVYVSASILLLEEAIKAEEGKARAGALGIRALDSLSTRQPITPPASKPTS